VNVCVAGLWHLGSVTAACLASAGHDVVGYDANESKPIFEPGLTEMIAASTRAGRLRFTSDPAEGVRGAEIVWIAYDTPVDDDDNADVAFVMREAESLLPHITDDTLVLISSQLPVGSTRALQKKADKRIHFAYSPENLRLGKAIEAFTKPDRVVVGIRREDDKARIAKLLAPFTDHIEWMSVESAEMTKHALNAFLATSIAFMNEIATICEHVGADAKEVERGLKSERRIGPSAYLAPGAAFAGGTLARDVVFLSTLGRPTLISSVKASNDAHLGWPQRRLRELLGNLSDKNVAVWGLTYKPGTDTLRRSAAIELCQWLLEQGANVSAHDPAVKSLPPELTKRVRLAGSALEAASGAQAVVVMTEWPDYREIDAEVLSGKLVLDANRFLASQLADNPRITYATVGKPVWAGEDAGPHTI
jgi:UDPglucose 6-dehydrogenase